MPLNPGCQNLEVQVVNLNVEVLTLYWHYSYVHYKCDVGPSF